MNEKVNKIVIFLCGAAVGAAVSAFVTRKLVDETYRNAADEEIYKAWQDTKAKKRQYQEQIKGLEEKITQQNVTIKTLADQVRRAGDAPVASLVEEDDDETEDDPRPSLPTSSKTSERDRERATYHSYSARYRGGRTRDEGREEVAFPLSDGPLEDDDYHEEEFEEEKVPKSGPVVISEDEFATQCMDYSKEDLRYFLFDGKILSEDGEYLDNYAGIIGEKWLLHGQNAGDEVYVRNDHLAADYRIIFTAGAGEEHITLSDEWDD